MSEQELSAYYAALESDRMPVGSVPAELIDEDWRLGHE